MRERRNWPLSIRIAPVEAATGEGQQSGAGNINLQNPQTWDPRLLSCEGIHGISRMEVLCLVEGLLHNEERYLILYDNVTITKYRRN